MEGNAERGLKGVRRVIGEEGGVSVAGQPRSTRQACKASRPASSPPTCSSAPLLDEAVLCARVHTFLLIQSTHFCPWDRPPSPPPPPPACPPPEL